MTFPRPPVTSTRLMTCPTLTSAGMSCTFLESELNDLFSNAIPTGYAKNE